MQGASLCGERLAGVWAGGHRHDRTNHRLFNIGMHGQLHKRTHSRTPPLPSPDIIAHVPLDVRMGECAQGMVHARQGLCTRGHAGDSTAKMCMSGAAEACLAGWSLGAARGRGL